MGEEEVPLLGEETVSTSSRGTIYTVMTLFGLASLIPWCIVTTAHDYYQREFHMMNNPDIDRDFESYFQIIGLGCNFMGATLAIFLLKPRNLTAVLITCNSVSLVIFIFITLMAGLAPLTETYVGWSYTFFIQTLIGFGMTCGVSATYMSAMFALSSILTSNAIQGFYLGQGIAGLFAAVLSIITVSIPNIDSVKAGFYYFLIATVILFFSLVAYLIFKRKVPFNPTTTTTTTTMLDVSHVSVLRDCWKFPLTTVLTSVITGACYPAALSTLVPHNAGEDGFWPRAYFTPVLVFLNFSFGDVLGRVTSSFVRAPGPDLLLPAACLRCLLIPLIYLSNLQPRTAPVWFHSDVYPALFNLVLSWSNGHVMSLAAAYGPMELRSKEEKTVVGTFLSFGYGLGLLLGSLCVFPLLYFIRI